MALNRMTFSLKRYDLSIVILFVASLAMPVVYAGEYIPTKPSTKYYSKEGKMLQFMRNDDCTVSCGIFYEDKLLLVTEKGKSGDERNFVLYNMDKVFLEENGKRVKMNGHQVLLRLVVQEVGGQSEDNNYWLVDVREVEPLVVGPIRVKYQSREYSVLWGEKSVTIVLDESRNKWKQGGRFFVEGESIQEKDGRLTPILTIDGKRSKKKESFPAYHYDYTTKKVTEALLMVD